MRRTDTQYREQLRGIQQKVTALASGKHTGPATALAAALVEDVKMLQAWTDPAPTLDPGQFLLEDIVTALAELDVSAYVEHTGGGVMCIYAAPIDPANGRPILAPFDESTAWPVIAGPGSEAPAGAVGDLADFSVQGNTDLFGDDEPVWAPGDEDDVQTIAEAVARRVRALGPLRTFRTTWTEDVRHQADVTVFSPTHDEMASALKQAGTFTDQTTYAELEQLADPTLDERLMLAAVQTPHRDRTSWANSRHMTGGTEIVDGEPLPEGDERPAILPTLPAQP